MLISNWDKVGNNRQDVELNNQNTNKILLPLGASMWREVLPLTLQQGGPSTISPVNIDIIDDIDDGDDTNLDFILNNNTQVLLLCGIMYKSATGQVGVLML